MSDQLPLLALNLTYCRVSDQLPLLALNLTYCRVSDQLPLLALNLTDRISSELLHLLNKQARTNIIQFNITFFCIHQQCKYFFPNQLSSVQLIAGHTV